MVAGAGSRRAALQLPWRQHVPFAKEAVSQKFFGAMPALIAPHE
jgi:hypothetical protein